MLHDILAITLEEQLGIVKEDIPELYYTALVRNFRTLGFTTKKESLQ